MQTKRNKCANYIHFDHLMKHVGAYGYKMWCANNLLSKIAVCVHILFYVHAYKD